MSHGYKLKKTIMDVKQIKERIYRQMSPQMNEVGTQQVQGPVLLKGLYPAKLKKVEPYEGKLKDGSTVSKLAWVFQVKANDDDVDEDIEFEGELTGFYEVAAHTYLARGDGSKFAELGFSRIIEPNWTGNTDDVIGTNAQVFVSRYEKSNGFTNNVINDVDRPPKKGKAEPVADDSEDFSDIPF